MPPPSLTPEQLRAMVEATRRARKVRRCAAVASFSGWTEGVFGVITLLMTFVSFAASGLFIGAALTLAAVGEFHGASLVRRFDPRGPRRLALNQLGLGACIVIYSIWSMATTLRTGAIPGLSLGDPAMEADIAGLVRTATVATYGAFAVIGGLGTGLTAWYYASRARLIREFRDQTDGTVIEALKAA